jgi:hypothetical protein
MAWSLNESDRSQVGKFFRGFLGDTVQFRLLEIAGASDNIHPVSKHLFTIYLQPINN